MLTIAALTIKKTITLFALVEPIATVPIFLAAATELNAPGKQRFARTIAIAVTIALLVATFLGMPLLALLGISMGAMQVGGGVIVLLLAIAMVLGKETSFKGMSPSPESHEVGNASIVPLAVPLLAGPAAFSYVMANGAWQTLGEFVSVVLPILLIGLVCWLTFSMASRAEREIRKSTLDMVERIGGFILAAIAVEMMATGLRSLFPILGPA